MIETEKVQGMTFCFLPNHSSFVLPLGFFRGGKTSDEGLRTENASSRLLLRLLQLILPNLRLSYCSSETATYSVLICAAVTRKEMFFGCSL